MTSLAAETKLELVTEAIETLVLASVVAATSVTTDRRKNHENVVNAREALKSTLRLALTPNLRIVTSNEPPREVPALKTDHPNLA